MNTKTKKLNSEFTLQTFQRPHAGNVIDIDLSSDCYTTVLPSDSVSVITNAALQIKGTFIPSK